MKITFISPYPGLSGGVRVVAIYAEHLKRRGHEVVIVSAGPRPLSFRQKLRYFIQGHGWPRTVGRRPSHFDALDVEWRRLDRPGPITDSDCPDADVVVATWWETAPWVAALSAPKGAKVYLMQDYGGPGQPFEEVRATWRLPLHLVTVSRFLKELILADVSAEIDLAPNGVNLEQFALPPRAMPERPTVGFLYSNAPQKGTDICIKAIQLARQDLPNLRVLSFGSRPVSAHVPLPPDTEHRPVVPDNELKSIYGACTAWLFGSRREGFGLPILEAMACRTPVIATPAGAAPDILTPENGVLTPHEDPVAMAEAIIRLCRLAPEQWRGMSEAAYATAARYRWEDAIDLLERALQRAIERRSRGEI